MNIIKIKILYLIKKINEEDDKSKNKKSIKK